MQSAGAAFDTDKDGVVEDGEVTNAAPILDRHTVALIAASAPGGISGKAVHYCASRFFTSPVDITRLIAATPDTEFPPTVGTICATTTIPCTGLDADAVKPQMAALAVEFFAAKLARAAGGGVSGTVPATLSLTLGAGAELRRVHAGRERHLHGDGHGDRDLVRG